MRHGLKLAKYILEAYPEGLGGHGARSRDTALQSVTSTSSAGYSPHTYQQTETARPDVQKHSQAQLKSSAAAGVLRKTLAAQSRCFLKNSIERRISTFDWEINYNKIISPQVCGTSK